MQGYGVDNLKTYGTGPFCVAVVHGGPGAAGQAAPVARRLSRGRGVLEPLQTAASLQGQIEELETVLRRHGTLPVVLIGFSWGAWLSFMVAALYPPVVRKLVLVSSPPFEAGYARGIQETRLSRLEEGERSELESLIRQLDDPAMENKTAAFARFGALFSKADAYDSDDEDPAAIDYRVDIFESVWRDAAGLRRSGRLLELGKRIRCPVVAIHGDYDAHPAEGVRTPLTDVLEDFRFILLERCGHVPWTERHARDAFYRRLEEILACGI